MAAYRVEVDWADSGLFDAVTVRNAMTGTAGAQVTPANSSTGGTAFDGGGSSSSILYDSQTVHSGTSARFSPTASSRQVVTWTTTVGEQAEHHGWLFGMFTSAPPARARLFECATSTFSQILFAIAINTNRTVSIVDLTSFSDVVVATSSTVLATGSPFRLEWDVTGLGGSAVAVCRLFVGANYNGATPDETITSSSITTTAKGGWYNLGAAFAASQTWTVYLDQVGLSTAAGVFAADVTTRVQPQPGIAIQYGRDQVRSLSPTAPGEASFDLDNTSMDYSPENESSPLTGMLVPARPVRIQGALSPATYTLYRGRLDNYKLNPRSRTASFTCLDALADLQGVNISTDLYSSIRTGQGVGYILDAIGWPTDARDLDLGATVVRWWWEDDADAWTALQRLVNSEGPPAFATVDAGGNFVFRDRHHRITRAASTASQATFSDSGAEPLFSGMPTYDHGWREIVNSVSISVSERAPQPVLTAVWETTDTFVIADGETKLVTAQPSDPFHAAVTPVAGLDYAVRLGTVSVAISRSSGKSVTIFIKATGGAAVVEGMKLRAYPLTVARTMVVHVEEPTSIGRYGRRSLPSGYEAPWSGVHDAKAIGDVILAHRAERLPIVSVTLEGITDTRLGHQLGRDLSDRVTIVDSLTGLNGDFFVDRIEHRIRTDHYHAATFGCEKAPIPTADPFSFDTAGLGFNDGHFGAIGLDDPDTVFILDDATQGQFNGALFAT